MEISPQESPAGQLHPVLTPVVMSTWKNRSVQRICPAIPSESTEFSVLNQVYLGIKGKKNKEKKYFNYLIPGFKEN